MRKFLFTSMFVLLAIFNMAYAQQRVVTGTVTLKTDGSTLPGVTVAVKGTKIVAATNQNGKFSLKVPSDKAVLVFSFIGTNKEEVVVGANTVLNIQLTPSSVTLDEVVVVGYGSGKKIGTIVGSVTRVTAAKLQEKPSANVFDALQGKVAGLQVYTSSGEPSQLSSIRLHGTGSLGAGSTPLYVLDGVPINEGAMITINTNDFESFNILKDASATSIYGSRAANGVIYLTSKKGTANTDAKITLNTQYGVSSLANTDYFNNFMNTKQLTDFWVAIGYRTQAQIDALLTKYPNDTKWYKYYYKDAAPTYQGDLSIAGGSEKTTYYVSGSYYNQDGLAVRSNFERYTLRSNITSKANNWLSFGMNLSGSYDTRATNPYGTNSTNGGLSGLAQPFYTPYDANGNKYPNMIPGWNRYNPQYLVDEQPYDANNIQFNGTTYMQINLFKGLTIKSQAGLDAYDYRLTSKRLPSYLGSLNNGSSYEGFNRQITRTITNTVEYKFDLNTQHKFTVLGGQEGIDNVYTAFTGSSTGQTDDRLTLLNNGPSNKDATSAKTEYAYLSYFGRVDYAFDDKYFADFSIRNDASSRFGKDNRSATFYAGGLMWDAKKESFIKNIDILSALNLKASIGTSGNSDIGNYANLALMGSQDGNGNKFQYQSSTGWAITSSGNPSLGWETQTLTTLGAKFALFNDKYRFNIEYYNRLTKDMLIDVPYAYTTGFSSILSNVGKLKNAGIDIALDFDVFKSKDSYLTPYFNLNYNKEKVTELFQGLNYWIIPNTGVCWAVDQPVSYFYPIFAGIDPTDGRPMWYVPGTDITVTTKDKTKTTKDFNTADLQQNTGIKRYAPTTGGFGLNAGWKGLSLQVDFSFASGKYLINNDRYFFENPTSFLGYNQSTTVLDYWKKPGDVTRFPNIDEQFTQFDSRLIENASFVRLKNLSIGYSLPASLLKKTKMFTSAKFFVTGRNLLTFTNYSGPDPEVDSNLTLGVNPNTKQYSVGIELKF